MSSLYETPVQTLIEFLKVVVIALVIALIIRTFIVQPYVIPSGSMLQTLQIGDRIFVSKFSYGIHIPFMEKELFSTGEPVVGDIIVFPSSDPENLGVDYVKRVIGVGGDTLEIKNKQLYKNGVLITEPYVSHVDPYIENSARDTMTPITVPAGKIFVMGDNRDNSRDSRFWGFVDKDVVHGKVFIVYWSSTDFVNIKWDRIGKLLR